MIELEGIRRIGEIEKKRFLLGLALLRGKGSTAVVVAELEPEPEDGTAVVVEHGKEEWEEPQESLRLKPVDEREHARASSGIEQGEVGRVHILAIESFVD